MPTLMNLRLYQQNDETLKVAVTDDVGPWDLSAVTSIVMVIKSRAATPDEDGETLEVGNGITVTDAEAGELEIDLDRVLLAAADNRWYRLDLTQASRVRTIAYGNLTVTDT